MQRIVSAKRIACIGIAALAVSVGLRFNATHLLAQEVGGMESPTVILGTVAGDKGTMVSVPVYFRAGKAALRQVNLAVDFISNSVKFEKWSSEGAISPNEIQISIVAEPLPKDPKGLPRTRVKLSAGVAEAGMSKGLPEGLWVFLNFRLAPDAKPFAVSLQPGDLTATNLKGSTEKVVAEAGKVIVSAEDEAQIGCFFFTH